MDLGGLNLLLNPLSVDPAGSKFLDSLDLTGLLNGLNLTDLAGLNLTDSDLATLQGTAVSFFLQGC